MTHGVCDEHVDTLRKGAGEPKDIGNQRGPGGGLHGPAPRAPQMMPNPWE